MGQLDNPKTAQMADAPWENLVIYSIRRHLLFEGDIRWGMQDENTAPAVVTDVGAPLSHAAIVARESGIPAMVNCGDATARLKTGDRVRIDGTQGTIEFLETEP